MATHTASIAPPCPVPDSGRLPAAPVRRVSYTRSTLPLSSDAPARAAHGLDADRADHLAAPASAVRLVALPS
jgi:hypothetical protein